MPYLWAAYRMGSFADTIPPELSQPMFEQHMLELIAMADMDWIVHARQDDGVRPVGIVLAQAFLDGRRIEPHIDWFPWATGRNKLEGMAAFLKDIGKRFKIFVYVDEGREAFWERLKWYALIRRGCKVFDHFGRGENAFFYYTAGM